MNTPAIHKAIRLEKHPEEMAWLCFPDSDLPEGMSDLLRLAASQDLLIEFADTNDFNSEELSLSLFNFIEKTMLNEKNSDVKILGTDKYTSSQVQKFHFQLLMKIYHPDSSKRPDAEKYSSMISKAYNDLKKKEEQDLIRFSEHRRTSTNYQHSATQAQSHLSYTKTAFAIISALAIMLMVSMTGKLYDPANPELIVKNKDDKNIVQKSEVEQQQLMKVTTLKTKISTTPAKPSIQASSTTVQSLLKNLEIAYEEGNVDVIKPLLANVPDIKDQTEKQLNDKLETIFQITSDRKMVLFDFSWTDVSGELEGKGRFLSRYQLIGENEWLTREGTALVSAQKIKNNLKVTQFNLENQSID